MVELLRVDDRLLHGQVAYAWCKNLTVNLIVIANDEVTKEGLRWESWTKTILCC